MVAGSIGVEIQLTDELNRVRRKLLIFVETAWLLVIFMLSVICTRADYFVSRKNYVSAGIKSNFGTIMKKHKTKDNLSLYTLQVRLNI